MAESMRICIFDGRSSSRGVETSGEWACSAVVRLSRRYTVELTLGPQGFVQEWEPGVPKREGRRGLTRKEVGVYRKARDQLVAEVSERMGAKVMLVEM